MWFGNEYHWMRVGRQDATAHFTTGKTIEHSDSMWPRQSSNPEWAADISVCVC